MATLENIRKRGKLLAIVIGLALFAFILGDLIKKGDSLFSGSKDEVANIDGESIGRNEFFRRINNLEEIYKIQLQKTSLEESMVKGIRNQVWEQMVQEYLLKDSYENLGIDVSGPELGDLVKGKNMAPSQLLAQMFSNRETGEYMSDQAVNFFKNMDQDPNTKIFGQYLESELIKTRKFDKYQKIIAKGINVTNLEALSTYKDRNYLVDFEYTVKKFVIIPDTTVTVSESDIQKYYNENKNNFEQIYTRDIAYISFDVVPSDEDKNEAAKFISSLKDEFSTVTKEDLDAFVSRNSDSPLDNKHYKSGELNVPELDSFVVANQVGAVYGPYMDGEAYKISKITDIAELSDTVGARHILIQPGQAGIASEERAKAVADSLLKVIKAGGDFAQLATQYSADRGSKDKGGDLDKFTEGAMIKEFNDTCFYSKTGDVKLVKSQYGIHIVEITYQSPKNKKYELATISKELNPSSKTRDSYFTAANKFSAENETATKFQASVDKQKLIKKTATGLEPSTEVIAGIDVPSPLLNWTFNEKTELGNVSPILTCGDRFIIAVVTSINEEGIAPVEQVKDRITAILIKEKKGEKLAKEFKEALSSGKSFEDIAASVAGKPKEGKNLSFSSSSLPAEGSEFVVIATATTLEKDKVSEPVVGENGVYLLKITSITSPEITKDTDVSADAANLERSNQFRANRDAYEALKKAGKIKDKRYMFF